MPETSAGQKSWQAAAVGHIGQISIRDPAPEEIAGLPADHRNPHDFSDLRLGQSQCPIQIQRTQVSHDSKRDGAQPETRGDDPETPFKEIRPDDFQRSALDLRQERRPRNRTATTAATPRRKRR